jgi:nitrogen-specific signal transduction histidine kinase/HAMP domain-containing protein
MKLRSKLQVGILATLLLQMAVTGTFTVTTFLRSTRKAMESDLQADWNRARSYVEELKHSLTTELYQLSFFLQEDQTAGASAERLRELMKYFISLTNADRIVLIDDPHTLVVDERAGISETAGDLPMSYVHAADFRFPRNQFVSFKDATALVHLYLVTGTTIALPGGGARHLYLITNIDKAMTEAMWEKTGTEVAFYVGELLVASASSRDSNRAGAPALASAILPGDASSSALSRPLSPDPADTVSLVAFRSLLAEQVYVRSVLLTYLTAFLVTLAASLFIAAGMTSLMVIPFTRLSQWLHRYMDSGEVRPLAIRTRDEVGFLAGAFHGMVSTLIQEKSVIGDQLEQIRLLHAYNARIMDSIQAGIVVTDAAGTIEFCNSYFSALVDRPAESLQATRLRDVMESSFTLRGSAKVGEAFGVEADAVVEGLKPRRPEDGERHFTGKISTIALSGSRRGSLLVLEDVTAAERFWARMTIADKVTSLGLLSAGMAHEINNPLGAILSHVNYLKAVEHESDKLDSLTWIEAETNRIAAIIRRIRAYSAPGPRQDSFADLNTTMVDTLNVLRFTLEKRSLSLAVDLSEGLDPVICPPDELKQVVLNIMLNASEACADGGAIRVGTRVDGTGRAYLTVADDGVGIDPADLKNIFDPFFTTKGARQGNGLGLSICYAIVKRAGGEIRVASTPGKGTEVEVMLRVHERADRG